MTAKRRVAKMLHGYWLDAPIVVYGYVTSTEVALSNIRCALANTFKGE